MTGVVAHPEAAAADWTVCPGCRTMLYGRRLARALGVCPDCGHHHRLTAAQRLEQLYDPGTVDLHDLPASSRDVLGFTDTQPYPARLEQARRRTGLAEGVLVASGRIDGHEVVTAAMDFRFLGGSLGTASGELITQAAELALRRRVPLLIVSASGGARMQEGPLALMQMAKTSAALARLDEAGILTLSLVTDPTYGGVAASFATLCDVIIAEPGARLGFAGRRVIQQTIRESLPDDFQTAEFLLEHGLIDAVRPRAQLRATLGRLVAAVRTHPPARSVPVPRARPDDPPSHQPDDLVVRDPEGLAQVDPWRAVQQARELDRPTTLDYVHRAFDDFEELRGDRLGADCAALVGGLGRIDGRGVVVLGHQKGSTVAELTARSYGMASPAGYRKAARLMRLAAKLGLPVVTFVDTPGAYPGRTAEEDGQALAIARSIWLMASLPVPVLTLIIGEGGSGGALALAVADQVLIVERGVYSVITPEGCAAILWNDPSKAPAAASALRLDARNLLRLGVVDGVLREPAGGSRADHAEAARRVRAVLTAELTRLSARDGTELLRARRERFRAYGAELTARVS
ncbi:Acetyl-coenzyme A carboxylase carboxyl transferase subunits beta/alpha [Frankia canadensis]|uniref:Multifunctional fusion protein n=1 Tax=Frankia canadensis TaxID=1836972 RepID=A0A2I2KLG0_9ACTN|nr:acetyl-CoA carboxylase, carboxyltransferase subunit beta [Frankia canadensis]SNQ46493.1 Acetyl-coenzyme A carboxylase carboxyl transferase subunits beta/alpha [Frankia canadensis]SOU53783.1 Acetyl-coenzyme A carboxylase carboxyl transferase subunits beta/alpha [Frankia canadensis]